MVKLKQQAKSNSTRRQTAVQKQNAARNAASPSLSAVKQQQHHSQAANTVSSCCGCGTVIGEDSKALQCDKCQSDMWKCIDCLAITPEVYDKLDALPSCGLRWYCDSCDKGLADHGSNAHIDKLVSVVEKLVAKFEAIESKLENKSDLSLVMQLDTRIKHLEDSMQKLDHSLESRLAAVDGNVARYVQDHVKEMEIKQEVCKQTTQVSEDKDIEKRKKNMIIYRVPEVCADNAEDRMDGDMTFVTELFESVFEIKPENQGIEKIFRLGRRDDSSTQDGGSIVPRPLLVGLEDVEVKQKIWSNLKNLKAADTRFKGISVAHDMTPYQRAEIKRMVDEAKRDHVNTNADGTENYWFRVVGQGSKMRVMKVKKQN